MKDYFSRIKRIKKRYTFLFRESFQPATNGTNYKVFLSDKYVLRFRDDRPEHLMREANFLSRLNHSKIPKILSTGKINGFPFMIENRLSGRTLDSVWRRLNSQDKVSIINQVVEFLQYQRTQKNDFFYSVKTGKKYKNFFNYLTEGIDKKVIMIKKNEQANNLIKDLLLIINKGFEINQIFSSSQNITLVHGDLIIHNLLTDGQNLTGVLDWELALYGDPDYDLFRLYYYQECAKAYQGQGQDEIFESDYLKRLLPAVEKSLRLKNQSQFNKKYRLTRAIYYLNALYWAVTSDNPGKNIDELINIWNKKRD